MKKLSKVKLGEDEDQARILGDAEDQAVSETTIYKNMGVAEEVREIKQKLKPFAGKTLLIDPTGKQENAKKMPEMLKSKNFMKFYNKNFQKSPIDRPLEANVLLQHAKLENDLLKTKARLNYIREHDNIRRVKIDKQWKELERKELEFRDSFTVFNQFNIENAEKRQRAARKINDDRKLIRDRQQGIDIFLEEMQEIKVLRMRMHEEIKKYNPYMNFLRGVTEISRDFCTSDSIIKRFLELAEARIQLAKRTKEIFDVLEGAKDDLMKLIEEKNFIILGLNNQIANLQARYEHANIKALESEALVTEIKNNAVKQMGEIDAVKNSIWNTYTHMAMSKKHKIKIKKERIEDQMMYINRTLTELVKVNKQIIAEQKKQQQLQQNTQK